MGSEDPIRLVGGGGGGGGGGCVCSFRLFFLDMCSAFLFGAKFGKNAINKYV